MFQQVIELKFFGRDISNDKKVEKYIEIQWEALQLIDGAGQTLRRIEGNPNFNCCIHESKIKLFRNVTVKSLQWPLNG